MRAPLLIAFKDLLLLVRDIPAAFFTFVFPLGVAFFFGFVFGGGGGKPSAMNVAVWNGSGGTASTAFVNALKGDDAFAIKDAATREAGEALVRSDKAVGLIALPADFDDRAKDMLTGNGPTVDLVMDPSHNAEGGLITGKLAQISFQSMMKSMSDPATANGMIAQMEQALANSGLPASYQQSFKDALEKVPQLNKVVADQAASGDESTAQQMADWMPVRVKASTLEVTPGVNPPNMFAISFLQGIAWGLFGAVLSFTGSMVDERERGTLTRLMAAPISAWQILLGKATACFLTCVAVEAMLIVVGVYVCRIVVTSVPLLVVATLCTAFAFTGIMMVLAGVFRTQGGAQGAGRGALLVLALIGGGSIPVFVMPPVMQMASSISPFKWAVTAAEGATWRGLSLQDMLPSLGVLLAIGLICSVAAMLAMRRRLA